MYRRQCHHCWRGSRATTLITLAAAFRSDCRRSWPCRCRDQKSRRLPSRARGMPPTSKPPQRRSYRPSHGDRLECTGSCRRWSATPGVPSLCRRCYGRAGRVEVGPGDDRMRADVLVDALVDVSVRARNDGGSTPPPAGCQMRGSGRRMRACKRSDVQRPAIVDRRARVAAIEIDVLADAEVDAALRRWRGQHHWLSHRRCAWMLTVPVLVMFAFASPNE